MTDSLKAERKKAHDKMRDEIRIAVKEALLKAGIGRDEIRCAIKDEICSEVKKRANVGDTNTLLREAMRKEIISLCGGNYVQDLVRNLIKAEAQRLAVEFVDKSVMVKTVEHKETW